MAVNVRKIMKKLKNLLHKIRSFVLKLGLRQVMAVKNCLENIQQKLTTLFVFKAINIQML